MASASKSSNLSTHRPSRGTESFDYATVGVFHICVTDPDPEALVKKAVEAGGKQLGGYMDYSRYGHEGHKGVYMQDPWGNVVECMSLSLDRVATAGRHLSWYIEKLEAEKCAAKGKEAKV
ncbi:uncharacterized protein AB675_11574 [Cyphellophora attinorum]|uniref:VOC domain-containing protein n=1 Tax=Cyphellophora attinorum TaxID=1664694 RepID=A0A0N1P0A9_9EURO|nr:uncharacterized protein AB675_11574 [Phialophora attinorum]KPI40080.1 hypothetical protein AB675_11574 [Phialophora attinorum]